MSLPIEDLTPRQIVTELDRYIVGQDAAKRAVAVALRNRYRRQQLPAAERDDILPKNILMMGPTGVGKTEIARRLAQLARAPFIKVEATKFTEVGYVGRDVESMIRDLAAAALRLVEKERMEQTRPAAEERAYEIIVDHLEFEDAPSTKPKRKKKGASAGASAELAIESNPLLKQAFEVFGHQAMSLEDSDAEEPAESEATRQRRRRRLLQEVKSGKHDARTIEIETEESSSPFLQVFTPQGMEEMGLDMANLNHPFAGRRGSRSVTIGEAKEILIDQEARRAIDQTSLHRDAVLRTEQTGIIFLDEIDKVAGKQGGSGPDVSREGVQRDLLPIIEGSTVATKFGPVRTDHILFIAAGAFHISKPSDLIPELQGRLPIRVNLEKLTEDDFRRILHEPKNALIKQYQKLLEVDGVVVDFAADALDELARLATEVNEKTENIGARRLHTLLERLLEDILFEAPDTKRKKVKYTAKMVRDALADLVQDADLSRYIL
ncbi:MAG TPA: ATP-dependent protease ATPase subunit HslU [Fimbriimonadaceae bacterium]|nr:ATP-dependent protease ATPase subunit HslU [Fimbriimonadaceae bacterium]